MKLKRFLLRYYPPGIILEYELRDATREMKEIDLLHLTAEYVTYFHYYAYIYITVNLTRENK